GVAGIPYYPAGEVLDGLPRTIVPGRPVGYRTAGVAASTAQAERDASAVLDTDVSSKDRAAAHAEEATALSGAVQPAGVDCIAAGPDLCATVLPGAAGCDAIEPPGSTGPRFLA